ncbi:calcium-binding protein, partial [Stappia indica]
DTVISSVSFELWRSSQHIENLTLTGTADLFGTGNIQANVIRGNSGNNWLDGAQGADTMIGGLGDDTYVVDNVGDTVVELAGQGTDTVISSVSFELWRSSQHLENLTLTGSANLSGIGNIQANVIRGNSGNNWLDGAQGADTMIGGLGNDTYIVDNVGDTVVELVGQGTDTVISSVSFELWRSSQHIENLTLTGSADLFGTGNIQANMMQGNSGNNWLDGAQGNDILTGGSGADTFVFLSAGDTDTITDFEHGIDTIRIGLGVSNFSQVTVTDVGADTHLTFGTNTIVLQNFDHTLISESDFSFV